MKPGDVFVRWTVLELTPGSNGRPARALCSCACGSVRSVRRVDLTAETSKSCGCLRSDSAKSRATHGHSRRTEHGTSAHSPEMTAWIHMHRRCTPGDREAANYADRGISVCERWASFANFLADMGPRPSSGHSIDRIDNNGDYEPSNCRWATRTEQARNRRSNRIISALGYDRSIGEWTELLGASHSLIWHRLRLGWPPERAVSEPPNPAFRHPRRAA